jgi:hypothetical protein
MTYEEWTDEMQLFWQFDRVFDNYCRHDMVFREAVELNALQHAMQRHRRRLIELWPEHDQRAREEA